MPYKVVIRGSIGTKASSKISCVLFKVNTLIARELLVFTWCNDRRLLHHNNDIKEVVSSQPSITW